MSFAPDIDDGAAVALGTLDLDAWRVREGLTYEALADEIGVSGASQARRYAIGERWPDPDIINRIIKMSGGAISLLALHHRRTQFLRQKRRRVVPVTTY
ncbi:MAG: helix-turn-helix transcriptional regulator [Pseudomonadota bacterium]